MTTPIVRHAEASEIIGSWPIIPPLEVLGAPGIVRPGTVLNSATILAMRRETSSGYDVVGKQFKVYIDNEAIPVATNIGTFTDPGPGYLTLDEVVTQINAIVSGLASNDNGFLRLTSPTAGDGSYLKLETDVLFPDTLQELGLFPGLVSRAGELAPAGHPDPVRAVSIPGQLLLTQGESFSSDAINRSLFQLSINSDRTEGLINRKRIAAQKKITTTYTGAVSGHHGYQFGAGVMAYTGREEEWAGASPTRDEIEKTVVILDADGRELMKEVNWVEASDSGVTFSVDTETGKQLVTSGGTITFYADDVTEDRYILSSSASLPAALQDVPMKITEYIDSSNAVIAPIDPATGDVVTFTAGPLLAYRIETHTVRCMVEGIYDSPGGTRVEGQQVSKFGPTTPTRVEKNNRVVFAGENLTSLGISVGDRVEWTGHLVTTPWSNNGTFRVNEVVDDETVELIGWDGEPVYLNTDLTTAAPGTLEITTDGHFYESPFLKFRTIPNGAYPEVGQTISIVYLGASNLRDALEDPAALTPDGVRYQQEADDTVQKAILAIIGPGVDTIDEYLHDDRRNNLEDLDYRLNHEHYPHDEAPSGFDPTHAGRHRDIRPDTIDMFPSTEGTTVTIRSSPSDANDIIKTQLLNQSGDSVWEMWADGSQYIRSSATRYMRLEPWNLAIYSDSSETGVYVTNQSGSAGLHSYLSVASGNNDAIIRATSGSAGGFADAEARLELDGKANTNGRARILMKGESDWATDTIGIDNGAVVIQLEGDSAGANPPQIAMTLRPGHSPPLFAVDWINDGAGGVGVGFRMGADGTMVIGDTLKVPVATVPLAVHSQNSSYSMGGYVFDPQIQAIGEEGGTGFHYVSDSASAGGGQAAFLSTFEYDDAPGNQGSWAAFKHMSEDPLITRFMVTKYGKVLCGLDAADNLVEFYSTVDALEADVGAWVRKNLLVGSIDNWDGFTVGDGFDGAYIWLMGGEVMGADVGPLGFVHGTTENTRYAQLYNCWPDATDGNWRYVTDKDYAIRIQAVGSAPGVGVWGHTEWAAAAPSTTAGAAISSIPLSTDNWVHALRWDHETGYISLGPDNLNPDYQLHLQRSGGSFSDNLVLFLENPGDGEAVIGIESGSDVQDLGIYLRNTALSAISMRMGIDYSTALFRMQPGLGWDSNFNSVADSPGFYMVLDATGRGCSSINNVPSTQYDLLIGTAGSVGSLLAEAYAKFEGKLEVTDTSADSIKTAGGIDAEGVVDVGSTAIASINSAGGILLANRIETTTGYIKTGLGAILTSQGEIYTLLGNVRTADGDVYTSSGDIYSTLGTIYATDGNIEVRDPDRAFVVDDSQGYKYEANKTFEVTYGPTRWVEGLIIGNYSDTDIAVDDLGCFSDGHPKYGYATIGSYTAWAWSQAGYYGGAASMALDWPNAGTGLSGFSASTDNTSGLSSITIEGYKYSSSPETRIRAILSRRAYGATSWTEIDQDLVASGTSDVSWTASLVVTTVYPLENNIYVLTVHCEGWQSPWWRSTSEAETHANGTRCFRIDGVQASFITKSVLLGGIH